jgi:hypothetical protein
MLPHAQVVGGVGIGDERAEAQAAVLPFLDLIQRQAIDVDDVERPRLVPPARNAACWSPAARTASSTAVGRA